MCHGIFSTPNIFHQSTPAKQVKLISNTALFDNTCLFKHQVRQFWHQGVQDSAGKHFLQSNVKDMLHLLLYVKK